MYWRLNADGSTEPTPDIRAANWEPDARRIGLTQVGTFEVSTVFLIINHQYGEGPPILFETMVFDKSDGDSFADLFCARYATKAAAEAGHAQVVAALEAGDDLSEIEVPS
jgi:hypothetical protein